MEEKKSPDQEFVETVFREQLMPKENLDECLSTQSQLQGQGLTLPLREIAIQKGFIRRDGGEKPSPPSEKPPPSRVGDFELISKIGEGGMGAVYKARQISMDRTVALKLLPENLAKNPEFVDRFYREARASARLDHPNVIRGIAVGEQGGFHYFAMEFVEGQSLANMISRDEPMPLDKALGIMKQVSTALAHAHERNVIHRDIKPSNVLVTNEGVAKLADLGLAKRLDAELSLLTQSGSGMGTPYYMPPEQARDAKRADKRSDVYALGATFYHMLTGQVPFSGDTPAHVLMAHLKEPVKPPHTVRRDIPERLSLIVGKMMVKDPANRFQDAGEVLKALESVSLPKPKAEKPAAAPAPKAPVVQVDWYFKKADESGKLKVYKTTIDVLRDHVSSGKISRDTPVRCGKTGEFMALRRLPEFGGKGTPTRFAGTGGGRLDSQPLAQVYSEIAVKEKRAKRMKTAKNVTMLVVKIGVLITAIILLLVYMQRIIGFIKSLF